MNRILASVTLLAILFAIQTSPATAQEPVRQQAIHKHGPIDESTDALLREMVVADGWQRPASPTLSDFENMVHPIIVEGDGWEIFEVDFDFRVGEDWIDRSRDCLFFIRVHSPEPGTEAFPVQKAEYYTPVFEPGIYWTYRYDGFWDWEYFFLTLEGPAIEGAQGYEPFIRWWLDLSHQWHVRPFVKGHWTQWQNTAVCEDEPIGDPSYSWDSYIVKLSESGIRHYNYLHMPYVE